LLKKKFKKSLEKVFLFKKCIYICTIIINQNKKTKPMKTFILINGKEVRIIKSQTIKTATIIAENLLDHSKEIIVREIEANAKLIASAPELLEALLAVQKDLEQFRLLPSTENLVNNAILKAIK
jgi:hypothetical protein